MRVQTATLVCLGSGPAVQFAERLQNADFSVGAYLETLRRAWFEPFDQPKHSACRGEATTSGITIPQIGLREMQVAFQSLFLRGSIEDVELGLLWEPAVLADDVTRRAASYHS
jgi:hypothetical protein